MRPREIARLSPLPDSSHWTTEQNNLHQRRIVVRIKMCPAPEFVEPGYILVFRDVSRDFDCQRRVSLVMGECIEVDHRLLEMILDVLLQSVRKAAHRWMPTKRGFDEIPFSGVDWHHLLERDHREPPALRVPVLYSTASHAMRRYPFSAPAVRPDSSRRWKIT
jgi:hypothetical protein